MAAVRTTEKKKGERHNDTYGVLMVMFAPRAAGMAAARAVTRVMNFIVGGQGVREVSLSVGKSLVVEEKMVRKECQPKEIWFGV